MKKIFTLMAGLFLTLAVFAANRPTVTIKTSKKYEIVIDGKSYYSNHANTIHLNNLKNGKHTVKVFELNQSLFRTTRRLVSSSTFRLTNKDVAIMVDNFGHLKISESKFGKGYDRRNDWDRKYDRNGRRF
jgi:hypothetical protein